MLQSRKESLGWRYTIGVNIYVWKRAINKDEMKYQYEFHCKIVQFTVRIGHKSIK